MGEAGPAAAASPARALLAACGAGVLWGSGALVVDILIARHGFTPENISFWRFLIGAVVLVAVFGRPGLWHAARQMLPTLLLAGTAMAGYVLCWFLAIARIGASVPTLIALCLPPVIVTLIALLRGRQRPDRRLLMVLAAALTGTALIVLRHHASTPGPAGTVATATAGGTGTGTDMARMLAGADSRRHRGRRRRPGAHRLRTRRPSGQAAEPGGRAAGALLTLRPYPRGVLVRPLRRFALPVTGRLQPGFGMPALLDQMQAGFTDHPAFGRDPHEGVTGRKAQLAQRLHQPVRPAGRALRGVRRDPGGHLRTAVPAVRGLGRPFVIPVQPMDDRLRG